MIVNVNKLFSFVFPYDFENLMHSFRRWTNCRIQSVDIVSGVLSKMEEQSLSDTPMWRKKNQPGKSYQGKQVVTVANITATDGTDSRPMELISCEPTLRLRRSVGFFCQETCNYFNSGWLCMQSSHPIYSFQILTSTQTYARCQIHSIFISHSKWLFVLIVY